MRIFYHYQPLLISLPFVVCVGRKAGRQKRSRIIQILTPTTKSDKKCKSRINSYPNQLGGMKRCSSLKQLTRLSNQLFRLSRLQQFGSSSSSSSGSSSSSSRVETSVDVSKVFDDNKQHVIKMPSIMDSESGIVNKWLIKEGESFGPDDTLCEATIEDMIIGMKIILIDSYSTLFLTN